jgi:rhodanese-related sulfurtransferase
MASHDAAREAAKLGYRNVFVMSDGISGWVKKGKPVESGGKA